LASFAYTRILTNQQLLQYFEDETKLLGFWKTLSDAERIKLWGGRLDFSSIPIVRDYDQWWRAILQIGPP